MLERTKFKIEEARFFLGEMEKKRNGRQAFRFFADAFLSAAYGALDTMRKEGIRINRQWFQDNHENKWYELKNHILIQEVRNPSTHEGHLPISEIRPEESITLESCGLWTVSYKVFSRSGSPIAVGKASGFGNIMIPLLNDVQLRLPDMALIGNEKEVLNFEVEHNFRWLFNLPNLKNIEVLDACKSYFNSLDSLFNKIFEEMKNQILHP